MQKQQMGLPEDKIDFRDSEFWRGLAELIISGFKLGKILHKKGPGTKPEGSNIEDEGNDLGKFS